MGNDDRKPVTLGDLRSIMSALPEKVRGYVREIIAEPSERIGYFARLFGVDPKDGAYQTRDTTEVLGPYGSLKEALGDIRQRLEGLEGAKGTGGAESPKKRAVADLRRYIEEELVPRIEALEGPRIAGAEPRTAEPTGLRDEDLREILTEIVKVVFCGEPNMQRYLKLLEKKQ